MPAVRGWKDQLLSDQEDFSEVISPQNLFRWCAANNTNKFHPEMPDFDDCESGFNDDDVDKENNCSEASVSSFHLTIMLLRIFQ